MALAHLTVAGGVEAALTVGVVADLQRANLPVLRINHPGIADAEGEHTADLDADADVAASTGPVRWRWAAVGLAALAAITPLGLVAPGGAFGEDAPNDLDLRRYGLDAVPSGLRHYAGFWHHALFDGYGFADDAHPAVGYLVSAAVGLAAAGIAAVAITLLVRRLRSDGAARGTDPALVR
jgi:cobalt/nickel transport system permease protein